jgi:hypothetical protein
MADTDLIDDEQLDEFTQDLMRAVQRPLQRPPSDRNVILVLSGLAFVTAAVVGATEDPIMLDFFTRVLGGMLPKLTGQPGVH